MQNNSKKLPQNSIHTGLKSVVDLFGKSDGGMFVVIGSGGEKKRSKSRRWHMVWCVKQRRNGDANENAVGSEAWKESEGRSVLAT